MEGKEKEEKETSREEIGKRKKINDIDRSILELLEKRIGIAKEIGKEKQEAGQQVYDPKREKEVIESLKMKAGEFPKDAIPYIFEEIMSACRESQEKTKISFLVPENTFTHMAAIKKFGSSSSFHPEKTIQDVFKEVASANSKYGVVPIENSIEGTVNNTLDMFINHDLKIFGEIYLDVQQNLISKYNKNQIEKIFSHPQAFAQCKEFLSKNFPNAGLIEVSSTADAVDKAELYHSSAAIASELAAVERGMSILHKGIQDIHSNKTRFLVIANENDPNGEKISIVFSVPHKPGTLYKILQVLNKYSINMTKIESRPSKSTLWEYLFFIDFEGNLKDENIKKAITEIKDESLFLKVLGCYTKTNGNGNISGVDSE